MSNFKKFLVIGGNSGIGKAVVDILDNHGHTVIVCDKEISSDIVEKYQFFKVDLRDQESVLKFANNAISLLGISNLIYSAGYQENIDILDLDVRDWDTMFQVQVSAAFVISQAVARNIIQNREGVIVYISSIHGEIIRGIPHYSSSKAAQNMMMKEFAYKLAPVGGRVFSIAPGSIDTPLLRKDLNTEELFIEGEKNIPMKRHGNASDIAAVLYNLLDAEYLTGQVIVVDGGLSLII